MWTTADITRNFSLAVYDTLYGYDAELQRAAADGRRPCVSDDGKQWDLTLRDGLKFHDGTPVLARDCVATIQRFGKRDPFGQALMARTDEVSRPSDKAIRFRLKKPFPLLPNALAEVYCAIMPERLAQDRRVAAGHRGGRQRPVQVCRQRTGSRLSASSMPRTTTTCRARTACRVSMPARRSSMSIAWCGTSFPIPATAAAALQQGEIDWWENPTIDLVPQLKRNKDITVDGEGPHRRNRLPALQSAVSALRQCRRSGAWWSRRWTRRRSWRRSPAPIPSLIKTDVGLFVPGTPMASTVGVEITRGPKDLRQAKEDLPPPAIRARRL